MNIGEFIDQIEQQRKEQDAIYHNVAVAYGLSDTAMWVLYFVSNSKEVCTQHNLCQQSYYAKQTINTAITNLVKNGYVDLELIPGTRNHKKILRKDGNLRKTQQIICGKQNCGRMAG